MHDVRIFVFLDEFYVRLCQQTPGFLALAYMYAYGVYIYNIYTGLFEMIVGVLTTCHAQYTWDSSICIFLFT